MKNKRSAILAILALLFVVIGCSTWDIQKRRYRRGYMISFGGSEAKAQMGRRDPLEKMQSVGKNALLANNSGGPKKYGVESTQNKTTSSPNRDAHVGLNSKFVYTKNGFPVIASHNKTFRTMTPVETGWDLNELFFLLGAGGFTSVFSGLILGKMRRPNKLACWSRRNVNPARGIIVGARAVLIANGLYFGKQLFDNGIYLGDLSHSIWLALFSLGVLFYPRKKSGGSTYSKEKLGSFIATIAGFLLLISATNTNLQNGNSLFSSPNVDPVHDVRLESRSTHQDMHKAPAVERTELEIIANVLVTILLIGLTIALLYLTLILSCELSCSGQEGLAGVVLIGGILLSLFLFIVAVRALWKPRGSHSK